MSTNKVIEVTPELNRRIQGERRKESRERLADAQQRLALIAKILESSKVWQSEELLQIYRLAKGE